MPSAKSLGLIVLLSLAGCRSAEKPSGGEANDHREAIRKVVREHLREIRACYDSAQKINPKVQGKLVLEWDVSDAGKVDRVEVIQSVEPKLDHCVATQLSSWSFPPPKDSQTISRIRYPFVFNPGEEKPVEKQCEEMEKAFTRLCGGEPCRLTEKSQSEKALQIIESSPRLDDSFGVALKRDIQLLAQSSELNQEIVQSVLAHMNKDCWSPINARIWSVVASAPMDKPRAVKILKGRFKDGPTHNPSLLGVSIDTSMLLKAADTGVLIVSDEARTQLRGLKFRVEATGAKLNTEYDRLGLTGSKRSAEAPYSQDELKQLKGLLLNELTAAQELREALVGWMNEFM